MDKNTGFNERVRPDDDISSSSPDSIHSYQERMEESSLGATTVSSNSLLSANLKSVHPYQFNNDVTEGSIDKRILSPSSLPLPSLTLNDSPSNQLFYQSRSTSQVQLDSNVPQGIGWKLLEKYGYSQDISKVEGRGLRGLGKNETGISSPIALVPNRGRQGLGMGSGHLYPSATVSMTSPASSASSSPPMETQIEGIEIPSNEFMKIFEEYHWKRNQYYKVLTVYDQFNDSINSQIESERMVEEGEIFDIDFDQEGICSLASHFPALHELSEEDRGTEAFLRFLISEVDKSTMSTLWELRSQFCYCFYCEFLATNHEELARYCSFITYTDHRGY